MFTRRPHSRIGSAQAVCSSAISALSRLVKRVTVRAVAALYRLTEDQVVLLLGRLRAGAPPPSGSGQAAAYAIADVSIAVTRRFGD